MRNSLFLSNFFLVALIATIQFAKAASPNVVLIMADDLGYGDLGCYGHKKIKTPVLDQLAREGIRLTSFYSGATVCTPSRMALMTGSYPARLGWEQGVVGYLMPKGSGLNPRAVTMAEVFKENGYSTAITGKWHLGDAPPFLPMNQGFQNAYFINKSNNQTDELRRENKIIEKPFDNRQLTEKFTQEAVRFINKNKDNPFFLYVPYSAPHFPVEAHLDWKGKSEFGTYGDVVEEMDFRIGSILTALEENGIEKNTLVIFLSDNGPEPSTKESTAAPLKGRKWSALEGGTRVPCIIRWPGTLPANVRSDALIAAIDFLPTLSHGCGIHLSSEDNAQIVDGVNVWDTLVAKEGVPHPRTELLYWHGRGGCQAIRSGNWKLFFEGKHAKIKGADVSPALFRLDRDIGEIHDVSKLHPEKVTQLQELARSELAKIHENKIELGKE